MNAQQLPISSPFGAASTAAQVLEGIDLSGRLAIVTGASSGIGLETARALAAAGARVICPVRDRAKAMAALDGIEGVTIETLDLRRTRFDRCLCRQDRCAGRAGSYPHQ